MANIILTSNAKFNPYTFDEMLKPLAMATETYNTIQDSIAELGTKADLIKMYANEVPDSRTANMYNSYAKDLEKQASMLAKQGLTPASRQGLLNMKRRYSSEITPIETIIAKREALTKEQREALLRDPSIMFDIDYSKTQLDYLLDNPNATYTSISGNELTKRTAQMAENLARVIQSNPKYQSILGGQYFQQMQQMGYTPSQIMQAVLNDEDAPAELRQIAENVFNEAGLNKYSRDIQERARDYINSGLYNAIGTTRYDNISNKGYVSPAEQEAMKMRKEQQDWQRELKEEQLKGILLPNGNRLKTIGGGKLVEITPEGKWTYVGGKDADKQVTLKDVAKVSDIPVIVANTNGKWRIGEEGKDVKGTTFGMTRSSLVSSWGNYTLDNINTGTVVTDLNTIPSEAAAKLQEAVKDYNLDLSKYNIIKVKIEPGSSSRAKAGDYDYVLMPKSVNQTTEDTEEEIDENLGF